MKVVVVQITKGLKARWIYSNDGVTWVAGKYFKGPHLMHLAVDRSMSHYHRLEVVEIRYAIKK